MSRPENAPFLPFILMFFLTSLERPTTRAPTLYRAVGGAPGGLLLLQFTVKTPINTDTNNNIIFYWSLNILYSIIRMASAPTFTDFDVQFPPTVKPNL